MKNLSVIALWVGLSGCGLVQVTTTSGPGSRAPGGVETDASPATAASGQRSDLGKRVAATYASWSFESCRISSCAQAFAQASGVFADGQRNGAVANPKPEMTNPDPEWLPGWDSLPSDEGSSSEVWMALHRAAANKSWAAACKEGYVAYAKTLDERVDATAKGIQTALAKDDPHERVRALLALPTRSKGEFTKAWEFAPGFDAASYETEVALLGELTKQSKLWVLPAERKSLPSNTVEILAPRWDPALEESAFCVVAAKEGLGEVKAWSPALRPENASVVRPVFTEATLKELAEKKKARRKAAADALSTKDAKEPKVKQQLATTADEKIVSFTVNGRSATLKLVRKTEFGSSIGTTCVDGRGRIGACPVMDVKKTVSTTIVFPDWPAGQKLEQGDVVSYFGESTSDIKGQGTPVETWTTEVQAHHVRELRKKDGSTITWW
jgi:hypothetical protein